jgi:hypothetical protein
VWIPGQNVGGEGNHRVVDGIRNNGQRLALNAQLAGTVKTHPYFAFATGHDGLLWPLGLRTTAGDADILDDKGLVTGIGKCKNMLYDITLANVTEIVGSFIKGEHWAGYGSYRLLRTGEYSGGENCCNNDE